MRSWTTRCLGLVLCVGALLAVPLLSLTALPSGAAQPAPEIAIDDTVGDVALLDAAGPAAPVPGSDAIDVTTARLFGETGETIALQIGVRNLAGEFDSPTSRGNFGVWMVACFTWNGAPFAVQVGYRLGGAGELTKMTNDVGSVDGECTPGTKVPFAASRVLDQDATFDMHTHVLAVSLDREKLASLNGDRAPEAGDAFGNLFAYVFDAAPHGTRYDQVPNAGPDGSSLALRHATSNRGQIRTLAMPNVGDAKVACDGRVDFPAYAVEVGGIRGIPVLVRNEGAQAADVQFSARTVTGADWGPRIVPRLEILPASEAGNYTATVIVDVPATAKHKDCTIVDVVATDGVSIGETGIIVVAVSPPSPTNNKLFLHTGPGNGNAGTCAASTGWLNVLADDPADTRQAILMKNCRDLQATTNANAGTQFALDINPSHDLILNTSATDKKAFLNVNFRSDGAPTPADLSVTVLTRAGETVAEGELLGVEIPTAVTNFPIPLRVAFTRDEVAEGDPSRLVLSSDGLAVNIRFSPRPAQANAEGVTVAGRVFLVPDGTHLDLPIFATIKRNVREPGTAGGLLSLRPEGLLPEFAYPGAYRFFNFSVLNEGPVDDVAHLSATFTGAEGWTATFVSGTELPLAAGRRATFQVAVGVPATAAESESVVFDVVATSRNDPSALASEAVRITATSEFGTPQEQVSLGAAASGGEGLPGPAFLAVLVALAGAAVLGRSTRRHP